MEEPPGVATYKLLYVLSRSRAVRHEQVVASFLDYANDPMVVRLALQTLCTFWGETARYLNDVCRFAAGVEWDYFGDVRQVALSAAGEYLRIQQNCELFRIVYDACINSSIGDVEERVALEALARALGRPLADSLNKSRLEEWRSELHAEGLSWLKANCESEK
jgi:hypothetical protein